MAIAVLNARLSKWQSLGTGIAVAGVLIVSFNNLSVETAPVWACGLTIGSMLIFALASVLLKSQHELHLPVCPEPSASTPLGVRFCPLMAGDRLAPSMTRNSAIGMAWLVLIATFATYSVYYTALRIFPAAKVSAVIYLSPPVTMLPAWALFDEPLTVVMFVGLIMTLAGVSLTSPDDKGGADSLG